MDSSCTYCYIAEMLLIWSEKKTNEPIVLVFNFHVRIRHFAMNIKIIYLMYIRVSGIFFYKEI